jgi:hypothetical protein
MKATQHPPTAPAPRADLTVPADQARPLARPMTGLRLRLKPKAPRTGYVDGAWWPRSSDLSVEVPALTHVLAIRLGRVTGVAYALEVWDTPPRQITVDGTSVRLAGFHSRDQYVVRVIGSDGRQVSLLVVPPEAAAAAAHDAMMRAALRGNTDRPVEILAAGGIVPDTTVRRVRLVSDHP